jgi:hypothetical protein
VVFKRYWKKKTGRLTPSEDPMEVVEERGGIYGQNTTQDVSNELNAAWQEWKAWKSANQALPVPSSAST